MRTETTNKEREIWNFIKEFIEKNGYSPTVREICVGVNLKSPSSVMMYLKNMRKAGSIDYKDESPRTITLTGYRINLVYDSEENE